jgi:hypothetical protein
MPSINTDLRFTLPPALGGMVSANSSIGFGDLVSHLNLGLIAHSGSAIRPIFSGQGLPVSEPAWHRRPLQVPQLSRQSRHSDLRFVSEKCRCGPELRNMDADGGFFIPYYFDIGAGGSNLIWQIASGLGYKLGCADLALTYRYLSFEQGNSSLVRHMSINGPMITLNFGF